MFTFQQDKIITHMLVGIIFCLKISSSKFDLYTTILSISIEYNRKKMFPCVSFVTLIVFHK